MAVKCLKDHASEEDYTDLASELKILIHIGRHKNIVNLLGACTINGPLWLILEYCPYGQFSYYKSLWSVFFDKFLLTELDELL